ncbi:hypothetical protein GJAV_G00222450 [Gymnothorax javanicus]|nr:hypothetical protein GJAV_G00222450 [Gymnothorax javanicus]
MCGRMIADKLDKGEDVIQTGELRVAWGGICAYYKRQMEYVVCSGGFMVYLLPPIACPTNYATYHRNCSVADCGPLAECVSPGGCVCIDGYQLPKNLLPVNESYDCTDIDECNAKKSPCDPHSDCANTVGSYNCSCHPGFQTPNDTKASASNPCIDIDECVEEPGLCGPNADCLNTEGAHECTCSEGYHILPEGSMPNITNPCEDIDECLTDGVLELCGPNATCNNNVGSYICDCVPGFAATNPDNLTDVTNPCVDIEECVEEPLICGPNGDCSNTFGWYICDCHLGYQKTAVPDAVDPCEDIDECLIALCGRDAHCFNTPGSYYCACKEGYVASTGFTWEFGVSKCTSAREKIDSLNPPKGERPEVTFLKDLSQDLDKNPDIILPPGTVTGILSTVLMVSDEVPREQDSANGGNLANIVEAVSDKLMSTLIEPTSKKSRKSVKTPTMEINLQTIGPALNASEASIPELNVKGNTMTLNNLVAIAEENNGSASAVLMSADGMEKLMRPSFFQSENVTEILSDVISATLPKAKYTELLEPFNFTVYHKKQFQAGLVTCVYWENRGEETRWSVDGCTTAFSNETHTICSCTHLSTFAVLLQTEEQGRR